MMRLTKGNPQLAAAILLALTLIVIVAAVGIDLSAGLPFNARLGWPPSRDYTLSAAFQDANGVYRGDNVVIGGANVGQVAGVSVEHDQALVTVRIDRGYAPLHRGTVAAIRFSTLLAQKYIELTPAAGTPPLPDGAVIPSDQTVTPVDFDQFLSSLDAPTRAQLQVLVQELGGGVSGEAASINALVDNLAGLSEQSPPTLDTIRLRDPQLASIIDNLVTVAGQLAQSHQQLGQLIQNTATVSQTLARNDAALDDLLLRIASVSQDTTATLNGNEGNLRQAIGYLDPFLAQLNPQLSTAGGYLNQAGPTLQAESTYLIPEVVSAISQQDAGGHYLRQYVVINTCYDLLASKPSTGSNCLVPIITGLPRLPLPGAGSAAGRSGSGKKSSACPNPLPSLPVPVPSVSLPIPLPSLPLPGASPTPSPTPTPCITLAKTTTTSNSSPPPSAASLLAPLLSLLNGGQQ